MRVIDVSERKGQDVEVAGVGEEIAFEDAMEKLEAISARLAGENVPLDEAIALYELGVSYYDICKRKLDDAGRRIVVIEKGEAAGDE